MAKPSLVHTVLFFACALCACDSDHDSHASAASTEAGAPAHGGSGGAGGKSAAAGSSSTGPAQPGTFTHIYEQSFNSCKVDICHGSGRVGLDMSSRDAAYRTLVGVPSNPDAACGKLDKTRVVPGDPDNSLLYIKLDINAPCGQQMPIGGELSDAKKQEIHDWIADGAKDD